MRSPILSEKQYFSAHHTLISTISTTNTKATASWIPQPHIFFSHPQKKPFIFFFYNLSWIPTIWTVPGDFWALAFLKGGEKKILLTALLWNSSRIIWDPADNPLVIDLWILTQSLRIICCKPICCVKDVSSLWRFRTSSRSLDRGSSFGGEVLL